jgi:hypothetical protein
VRHALADQRTPKQPVRRLSSAASAYVGSAFGLNLVADLLQGFRYPRRSGPIKKDG